MECVFCKIVSGQIPCHRVYEDDNVLAFLDIAPVSVGHTLLISKRHFVRIDQCDVNVLAEVAKVLPKIAAAVKAATGADGYNILCNNGRAAGQLVAHMHFHIIPRLDGDGVFSHWPSKEYEEGQAEEILLKIKSEL